MEGTGATDGLAIENEDALVAVALALCGSAGLSAEERALVAEIAPAPLGPELDQLRRQIAAGEDPLGNDPLGPDPLGEAFTRLRSPERRRERGATYTPPAIVDAMLAWSLRESGPASVARIVDPGAGSGRFLLAAARRFPQARLIGIELDPLAALMLRANLAAAGLRDRAQVLVGDYRAIELPPDPGRTLFIGNPPYLRHHGIAPEWKAWYAATAQRFGVRASRLAGLHLHFFLRTLELARPGDLGCFVTAAEWLDVNYGAALRALLAGPLGLTTLQVLDPKALPFADAVTTGVIAGFRPGEMAQSVTVRQGVAPENLGDLTQGSAIPAAILRTTARWTALLKPRRALPQGWTALGELCRVHRGQVTGDNAVWIAGEAAQDLPPQLLFHAVTKARELLQGDLLDDAAALRRVIDLPADLDALDPAHRAPVERFLAWARAQGADGGYIARHRKAWWSVGLGPAAPILCTYMARRPPAFVRNLCGARHINIAHGLYPREPLPAATLDALAAFLRANVAQAEGRTYAGGLTKFEPKELERIAVPPLAELAATAASAA